MRERTQRKKDASSPTVLRSLFEAITVGEGKHAEPYVIAFHYKSDNIAGKGLGTLFGFFEVEVHDEDAAYIVNFLASVAKKEYFANPRRSVEDGFETTLHKINVALAEIAKEGNVSWLGHLHGIVGALSESTVHFSATGEGVLSLTREGVFRPISDGLAENLSEPHPLKTFTEVSSGRLMAGDVLLAFSPAIWTLFTPEDIKKNLARFDAASFEQFLKTALINELPIAGAVIIRIETETLPEIKATPAKSASVEAKTDETPLTNVWSKQAFEKAKAARLTALAVKQSLETEAKQETSNRGKEEYTDQKTGHIYVQGDPDSTETSTQAWRDRLDLFFQATSRLSSLQWEKWCRSMRRSRKSLSLFWGHMSAFNARLGRSINRRFRSSLRRFHEARAKRREATLHMTQEASLAENSSLPNTSASAEASPSYWDKLRTQFQPNETPEPSTITTRNFFQEQKERLIQLFSRIKGPIVDEEPKEKVSTRETSTVLKDQWVRLKQKGITFFQATYAMFRRVWTTRTPRERSQFLGIAGIILTLILGTVFYLNRSTLWESSATPASPAPTTVDETPAPIDLTKLEPLAVRLADGQLLTTSLQMEPIALVSINDLAFGITENQIVNVKTQTPIATPEPIQLATAMDDLDALFLLGKSGVLHMYTIANEKFSQSALPLPDGVQSGALGSYLTYLYVLDEKTKDIYRFPRAEGGFGTPIKWSKETITTAEKSGFTVGESIALINQDNVPVAYERGKKTGAAFRSTQEPISAKVLAFDKASGDLLALDQKAKRVIRWKADGTLVAQYFHNSLETATHILAGQNNTLLVVSPKGAFTFQLP